MVKLPWDILSDILVRLPAKSIARCRCVNKRWCHLMKNPEFLKRQYKHAVELNRFSIMFHNQNDVYTFSYDPSSSICKSSVHIRYPSFKTEIEFFGCCNGLVLLRHINKSDSHILFLWNPTTNECKKLPDPVTEEKERLLELVEYGIGYDHQIEDFKVVRIAVDRCEVHVYTLKSNSWRKLEDIQGHICFPTSDIPDTHIWFPTSCIPDMSRLPVNGSLYWKASKGNEHKKYILRFDFEKEVFERILIPDEVNDDHRWHLCVLGGSLWLLVNEYGRSLQFWKLKDNEVNKSWTNTFTIDLDKFYFMKDLIPLQFLKNGNFLFGAHNEHDCLHFILYDPIHETTRTPKAYKVIATSSFPTSVYIENLISLQTGTYLGQEQLDEEEMMPEKNNRFTTRVSVVQLVVQLLMALYKKTHPEQN